MDHHLVIFICFHGLMTNKCRENISFILYLECTNYTEIYNDYYQDNYTWLNIRNQSRTCISDKRSFSWSPFLNLSWTDHDALRYPFPNSKNHRHWSLVRRSFAALTKFQKIYDDLYICNRFLPKSQSQLLHNSPAPVESHQNSTEFHRQKILHVTQSIQPWFYQ